jgi:hypothetical protein
MENLKKLNEVKVGDKLYCIAYNVDGKAVSIVEITAKEVITDGPYVDRHIYSRDAIVIKEKVPNSPEGEGEYVIDQYMRGDECMTHSSGIYTTFLEAAEAAEKELIERYKLYSREERKWREKKFSAFEGSMALAKQILEYTTNNK